MNQEIARLTGKLIWQADNRKLIAFQTALKQVSRQMADVGRQFEAMQRKLNGKLSTRLGIKVDAAAQTKLEAQAKRQLDREFRAQGALQKLRRNTFTAELAQQKLLFAGKKESAFLTTTGIKDQQHVAVLLAKQHRAEAEKLKVEGQSIKNADSLATAKAKQTRAELINQKIIRQTAKVEADRVKSLTGVQRAELAMQQTRQRSAYAARRFALQEAASQNRATRQTERARQQDERHGWAVQRAAVWTAKQNAPQQSTGFTGLGTGALALGGVTAGLALVVGAVSALGDRIEKRQQAASDSQNYSNLFGQIGGQNLEIADHAQSEFARLTDKFGMANNKETAADFRVFMLSEQARGVSMTKAIDKYAAQLGAFRASGMSKTQQERAVIQLQQVRSIGHADTEDVRTFSEAAPLIKQAIIEAWAERTKYRGDNKEGAFAKAVPTRGVTRDDFEAGLARFVKEQSSTLITQMASIDAQQTRSDNAKFLQAQDINSDPELVAAIGERIKAETELTKSLAPLREAAEKLDAVFMTLVAKMINWTIGKDATPEDAAKKVDGLSTEKPAIDLSAFAKPVDPNAPRSVDPVDRLWNKLFGTPIADPVLSAPNSEPADMTNQMIPLIRSMPAPMTALDIQAQMLRSPFGLSAKDVQAANNAGSQQQNIDNSTHKVEAPVTMNVTINAKDADPKEVADLLKQQTRDVLSSELQKYMPKDSE